MAKTIPLQSFAEKEEEKEEVDANGNPINPTKSYISKKANGVTIWTEQEIDHHNEKKWVEETEKPSGYLEKLGAYAQ